MTTPHPSITSGAPSLGVPRPSSARVGAQPRSSNGHELCGNTEEWGPLVRQPANAARLARILNHSATDLWDLCTLSDAAQMWEEARAVASRILAACPSD
jgi:hypothetical protein